MVESEPPFSFRVAAARAVLAAFAVVLALSAAWALQAPAEAQSIRHGSFIRQSGADDIYRVKIVNGKRFKWLIVNEAAFCSYGCPWSSVINVSRSVLNRYTTSTLARRGSNTAVWRFAPSGDSGTRRWLNITAREFEAAGFDWDAVHSITTTDFNQYREVRPPLTCADFNVCNEPPRITRTGARNLSFNAGERVTSQRVATISDRDTRLRDLTVQVSGLPSGVRYNFSTSSGRLTVSGTAPSRAGTHTVTITASDGRGSDTERFTITVNETHDPEITLVNDGFGVQAGQRVTSRRVATISDRDTRLRDLEVQVSGLPSGWRHSFSTSSGRLTVSGTAPSRAGTHTVTITASDGRGSDRERFTITVAAPDCAETIQDGSFIRRSGTENVYRVKIVGSKRFKWLILNETAFNSYGVAWSRICDTSQSVLNRYTTSTLARLGDDPKVWRFEHTGDDTGHRRWLDLTASEFERAGFDWDAVFSLRSGDFNAYTAATPPITCDNMDGRNVCDVTEPTNTPPEITNLASLTLREGQSVGATQAATVTDADDALRLHTHVTISGLPSGLSAHRLSSNGQLTISGTVATDAAGTYTPTITANDGTNRAVRGSFRITVSEEVGTHSPEITLTDDRFAVQPDERVTSWRVATISDRDTALSALTVSVSGLPSGWRHSFSTSSGRLVVSGTAPSRAGSHRVTITASDGSNTTRETFQIVIVVDDDPSCDSNWGDVGPGTRKLIRCDWTERDSTRNPGDVATYTDTYRFRLTEPARVVIELRSDDVDSDLYLSMGYRDNGSAHTHGAPNKPARLDLEVGAGNHWIHAAALWEGRTGQYTLVVDFEELIGPPEFDPAAYEAPSPLVRGQHQVLNLPGRASGGYPPLKYTLRDAPAGMTFDANTLTLTGAPTGAAGSHTMYLRATDDAGRWDEQQIRYTISLGEIGDGSLIREQGTADVYLVRVSPSGKQFKRRILNEAVFNGYGWDWQDVHDVSADVMDRYTTSRLGQLAQDPKVWLLDAATSKRHWLNMTPAQFEAAGYDWDAIYTISQAEFNRWGAGDDVRACLPEEDPFTLGTVVERTGSWTSTDCTSKHTGRSGSYSDTWGFILTDQADVTIDLASTNADAYVYLVDNNGIVVEQDDNDGDGRNARISRTLLPGTYWVRATTKSPRDQGTYELKIAAKPGSCSLTVIELTPGEDRKAQGGWAASDCRWDIPGELTDTYHDRFVLRLSRGAKVMLHLNPTGDVQPVLSVWRGGRTKLREFRPPGGGADQMTISLSGGDYWIDVTTVSARETGSYRLTITTEPTYEIKDDLGTLRKFDSALVKTDVETDGASGNLSPKVQHAFRLAAPAQVRLGDFRRQVTPGPVSRFEPIDESNFGVVVSLLREQDDGDLTSVQRFVRLPWQSGAWPSVALSAGTYVVQLQVIVGLPNPLVTGSAMPREFLNGRLSVWPTATESIALTAQYTPILRFDEKEQMHPVPAEAMIENSALMSGGGKLVRKYPTANSLIGYNSEEYYLDFYYGRVPPTYPWPLEQTGGDGNGGEWKDALKDSSKFVQFKTPKPTAYVHLTEYNPGAATSILSDDEDWKGIQYWFFYVYNNADLTDWDHEGDWEAVTFWWKDAEWEDILGDGGVRPTEVGFSAHSHGYYVVPSENNCLSPSWRRPVAYVAANNHPMFVTAGLYGNVPDFENYRTYARFTAGELARDEARATGKTLTYGDYDVRVLDAQPWFSWRGRWGAEDGEDRSGPPTPGQGARRHWRMPPSEMPAVDREKDWWKRSGCHSTRADQSWRPPLHGVDALPTYG